MLKISNQAHFDKVKEFAEKTGQMEKLQKQLDYLDNYACHGDHTKTVCVLGHDFAPASFSFYMMQRNRANATLQMDEEAIKDGRVLLDKFYDHWFAGGLIYHGSHDGFGSGSAPTLSVTLEPTDGWAVHT